MMPSTELDFAPKPLCEIVTCNALAERLLKLVGKLPSKFAPERPIAAPLECAAVARARKPASRASELRR
ncbi:hypothetical protein PGT21_016070 [Puccinia graminis f. sp. tritici]|uniref:Uncharacterized protein n=1 Tax=Puccinia graminis f. sp. tritici TaxID=56615 RepID=A0A5B0NKW4_PUCGR|nr:hypothetical protein PGT21_016070 [Puccinia graminis f. sp. tritici]